jgi:hypothetical protein
MARKYVPELLVAQASLLIAGRLRSLGLSKIYVEISLGSLPTFICPIAWE